MKKLLPCQKKFLLTRSYDEKTDTLMYQCKADKKRNIIAIDCTGLTDEDVASNADYNALCSIRCQCCIDCKECKEVYHS